MNLKAVGQRIKAAREAKNLTQEELAEIIDLSATHVSVIERGVKVTRLDTFVAIANALDVSAKALLFLYLRCENERIRINEKSKGIFFIRI